MIRILRHQNSKKEYCDDSNPFWKYGSWASRVKITDDRKGDVWIYNPEAEQLTMRTAVRPEFNTSLSDCFDVNGLVRPEKAKAFVQMELDAQIRHNDERPLELPVDPTTINVLKLAQRNLEASDVFLLRSAECPSALIVPTHQSAFQQVVTPADQPLNLFA